MKALVLLVTSLHAISAAPQFGGFYTSPKQGGGAPKATGQPKGVPKGSPRSTTTTTRTTTINTSPSPRPTALSAPSAQAPPKPLAAQPKGPACKNIPGDAGWPAEEIWKDELPGVIAVAKKGNDSHPQYHYSVRNHGDVQAAVNFAAQHNVRLSVIASGHDFLGRNDAPTGLGISVDRIKGVVVHQDYTPTMSGLREIDTSKDPIKGANILRSAPGKQAYVTFGTGVTTQELNNALEASGLFTMGAAHGEVTVSGGWAQAAGHGPLTSSYGLGVDQVVEYQVITADGRLRIANAVSEPDLFWALRGGGAGTFGIVVQATVKAYPSPKMTISSWWINTTETSNASAIYEPAAYLHSLFPNLNARGVQGYYYVFPNALQGIFLTAGNDAGAIAAKRTWSPILAALSTYPGMGEPISEYSDVPNFKTFFDSAFGPLEGMKDMPGMSMSGGEPAAVASIAGPAKPECVDKRGILRRDNFHCAYSPQLLRRGFLREANDRFYNRYRRHGPEEAAPGKVDIGPAPSGIIPMDSRLLDRAALTSPELAKALQEAMPKLNNAMLRGHLVAGGKAMVENKGTSVNPAWRKAYVHIIGTGVGVPNIGALKTLAKDSGAYSNEASWRETNWKQTFWGSNYERLSRIKSMLDPEGIFYVTPGINADHYGVQNGRLCRVTPSVQSERVPAGDSTAIGKHAESGNDVVTPWPKNQAEADANAKKKADKLSAQLGASAKGDSTAAASAAASPAPFTSVYPGASASSTAITDASVASSPAPAPPAVSVAPPSPSPAAPSNPVPIVEPAAPSNPAPLAAPPAPSSPPAPTPTPLEEPHVVTLPEPSATPMGNLPGMPGVNGMPGMNM